MRPPICRGHDRQRIKDHALSKIGVLVLTEGVVEVAEGIGGFDGAAELGTHDRGEVAEDFVAQDGA
jgi:hypothetical protein